MNCIPFRQASRQTGSGTCDISALWRRDKINKTSSSSSSSSQGCFLWTSTLGCAWIYSTVPSSLFGRICYISPPPSLKEPICCVSLWRMSRQSHRRKGAILSSQEPCAMWYIYDCPLCPEAPALGWHPFPSSISFFFYQGHYLGAWSVRLQPITETGKAGRLNKLLR